MLLGRRATILLPFSVVVDDHHQYVSQVWRECVDTAAGINFFFSNVIFQEMMEIVEI